MPPRVVILNRTLTLRGSDGSLSSLVPPKEQKPRQKGPPSFGASLRLAWFISLIAPLANAMKRLNPVSLAHRWTLSDCALMFGLEVNASIRMGMKE